MRIAYVTLEVYVFKCLNATVGNPFIPQPLIGRRFELDHVTQLLYDDRDFVITGVCGIGRRTLIRAAAKQVGARILEIDCLRCRSGSLFLRSLADVLTSVFSDLDEITLIQKWSLDQPLTLDQSSLSHPRLIWPTASNKEWVLFQELLALPQQLAEWLNCQVVIVFHNLHHIRSWDRQGKWEAYLREEIQRQSRVSYVLIATIAEPWVYASNLPVVPLPPLSNAEVETWIASSLAAADLQLDPPGLDLFLSYIQGHLKDAVSLGQRIWLDYHAFGAADALGMIGAHHVQRSMLALVQDMSSTFEALLLLLPPSQARILESLAVDPTASPQAQAYIKKHQLSRGGGLQGALNSLEQKGLIYGPQLGYQLALPLLNFWLKQRLN